MSKHEYRLTSAVGVHIPEPRRSAIIGLYEQSADAEDFVRALESKLAIWANAEAAKSAWRAAARAFAELRGEEK